MIGEPTMKVADRQELKRKVTWRDFLSARNFRRFVQVLALLLYLALFFAAVYPLKTFLPPDMFLRLSLLNDLSAMLSSRTVIQQLLPWALVVLVATLLLGRVFCGWVCPLGTVIDITDRFFEKRRPTPTDARTEMEKCQVLLARLRNSFRFARCPNCLFL